MLIAGCLLLVVSVVWESYCEYPLMPLRVWRNRNFSFVRDGSLLLLFKSPIRHTRRRYFRP